VKRSQHKKLFCAEVITSFYMLLFTGSARTIETDEQTDGQTGKTRNGAY